MAQVEGDESEVTSPSVKILSDNANGEKTFTSYQRVLHAKHSKNDLFTCIILLTPQARIFIHALTHSFCI